MDSSELSKEQLLAAKAGSIDTQAIRFEGLRGERARHLDRSELEARIARLPPAPADAGTVDLMVARGPHGERHLPVEALFDVEQGMPGDRWVLSEKYGPEYQLATMRTDLARLVANGQHLELHGDNLFLSLDISSRNLPPGSTLRLGEALMQVTPQPHNGCKKWVQRFGLAAMQLNQDPEYHDLHLRGIYLCVVEPGRVRVGDRVAVVKRG